MKYFYLLALALGMFTGLPSKTASEIVEVERPVVQAIVRSSLEAEGSPSRDLPKNAFRIATSDINKISGGQHRTEWLVQGQLKRNGGNLAPRAFVPERTVLKVKKLENTMGDIQKWQLDSNLIAVERPVKRARNSVVRFLPLPSSEAQASHSIDLLKLDPGTTASGKSKASGDKKPTELRLKRKLVDLDPSIALEPTRAQVKIDTGDHLKAHTLIADSREVHGATAADTINSYPPGIETSLQKNL